MTGIGAAIFPGCHTLANATVKCQVENGGGAMPAFKGTLSDATIANVAAYVSSVAGQ